MTNYYITPKLRLLFNDAIETDSQLAEKFEEDWERIQTMNSFEFEDWVKSATPEALTNFHNYCDYKLKYNNFGPKVKRFLRSCGRLLSKVNNFDCVAYFPYYFIFIFLAFLIFLLKMPLWISMGMLGLSTFTTWLLCYK